MKIGDLAECAIWITGEETETMLARRGLATAIDGLLKPSTSRWFWMKAKEDQINEDDQAKAWFDAVGDRMWSAGWYIEWP